MTVRSPMRPDSRRDTNIRSRPARYFGYRESRADERGGDLIAGLKDSLSRFQADSPGLFLAMRLKPSLNLLVSPTHVSDTNRHPAALPAPCWRIRLCKAIGRNAS